MFQIVYLSSATQQFTKPSLIALLEKCRTKNARLGITGVLLYSYGNIMQTIEGEEPVVRGLFQKISSDSRHHGLLDVIHEPIAERSFPDWSMSFRDLSLKPELEFPGFNHFLQKPMLPEELLQISGKVRTLMQVFKKNTL